MKKTENKFNFNKWLKLGGNILTIIVFIFIAKSLLSFDIDYSVYFNLKSILYILLFILVSVCSVILGSINWKLLLSCSSGQKLPQKEITKVYVKSNLGKYLPGNVMQFAGRNILGKNLGITQTSIAISSVLEIIMLCITSAVWSILLAGEQFISIVSYYVSYFGLNKVLFISFFLLLLGTIILFIIYKKFRKFFSEIKSLFSLKNIPYIIKSFALLSTTMLLNGFILTMIVGFSEAISIKSFLTITVAFIISWLVGFVIPGAPGGIGVREAVLSIVIGNAFGEGVILSAALLQRFILILADVLSYILLTIIFK